MGRRKVVKNRMDYLLTVVEERHHSVIRGAPTDIRFSVKNTYLRYFDEKQAELRDDDSRTAENQQDCGETFEIAPTLGVKDIGEA
jgi:hypothetical protein